MIYKQLVTLEIVPTGSYYGSYTGDGIYKQLATPTIGSTSSQLHWG